MSTSPRQIAIQHFRMSWTKNERGAEFGAIRKAMPRDHAFAAPGESEKGWLQRIDVDIRKPDSMQDQWRDLAGLDKYSLPAFLQEDGDFLKIRLNTSGKIKRGNDDVWIARLPFGQKLVIDINNAHDGDHQRMYRDDRITIGRSSNATLDLPLFRHIDLRKLLY